MVFDRSSSYTGSLHYHYSQLRLLVWLESLDAAKDLALLKDVGMRKINLVGGELLFYHNSSGTRFSPSHLSSHPTQNNLVQGYNDGSDILLGTPD